MCIERSGSGDESRGRGFTWRFLFFDRAMPGCSALLG